MNETGTKAAGLPEVIYLYTDPELASEGRRYIEFKTPRGHFAALPSDIRSVNSQTHPHGATLNLHNGHMIPTSHTYAEVICVLQRKPCPTQENER